MKYTIVATNFLLFQKHRGYF